MKIFKDFQKQGNEVIFIKKSVMPQGKDFNENYQVAKKANTEQAEYLLKILYDFLGINQ